MTNIFIFFIWVTGHSQNLPEGYSMHFPTENISKKEANKNNNRPKRKKYAIIYKSDPSNILYGNPCAIEATKKMGFIYELQPPGLPGSKTEKQTFYHNLWVNIKLIFTRSPFWKIILNRKIEDCREKTGDLVG